MSIMCREEMYLLEQMAKNQKQIYVDACDYGVMADDKFESPLGIKTVRDVMKEILQNLLKCIAGGKVSKWGDGRRMIGRSYDFHIPIEYNDRQPGMVDYIWVNVSYNHDIKAKKEFFSIDMKRVTESKDIMNQPKWRKL